MAFDGPDRRATGNHELAREAIRSLCARLTRLEEEMLHLRQEQQKCRNCRPFELQPKTTFEG